MLSLLHIENIAVIECADISFDQGFNVLTGETGAGKSIIVDSMALLLGGIGVYQPLVEFAGAGASVPLLGFGNTLAKGVREAVAESGFLGVLTGGLKSTAGGITAAIIAGLLVSLIFKPRDKS